MPTTKIELPNTVSDFSETLSKFSAGKLYVADGGYSQLEASTKFATKTTKDAELESFDVFSDLAEKPGKCESNVEMLKTCNYLMEGKRTNTVELILVGVNNHRKAWLEQELNKKNRTLIIDSQGGDAVLIFNDRRWTCVWSYEIEGLFQATLKTEYGGSSSDGFMIFKYDLGS
ncbi:MAG: hypothetical protein FWG98_06765 [Candidatus Cloacimonetes bacterium]|nr:hypothetical protein [Candidatus Cloacimonadota bacterium]